MVIKIIEFMSKMKIFATIQWKPLVRRVLSKKGISGESYKKHSEIIQQWYQTIWHENQALGYKIHRIEWSDASQVSITLDTSEFIASYFYDPPLDGNNTKLKIPHIGYAYPANQLIDVTVVCLKTG